MRAAASERGIRPVLDEIASHLSAPPGSGELQPPADLAQPELLGQAYEAMLAPDERRRAGAFYTPAALAADVVAATIGPLLDDGVSPDSIRVCDPAVGGGSLLLAAGRLLIDRGADPVRVVERQLAGVDVDPVAVDVARAALRLIGRGGEPRGVVVGDALGPLPWSDEFDAVVTNPPFLNQLRTATTRSVAAGPDRWGGAARGYADTANLFLLLSLDLVRPGGRVGIVLPEPILSARDAAPTRGRVGRATKLDRIWSPGLGAFAAGVRVVIVIAEKTPAPAADAWQRGDWALLADRGVPALDLESAGTVGDIACVTADFRDQYYAVAAIAADDDDRGRTPLVTCGLIDPAHIGWGERTARLAHTEMLHPTLDPTLLAPRLQRWAATRLVPKIMLATQTRILEAVADPNGRWLPVVPIITVVPQPDRLWHVLAALSAPPVSAHAHRAHAGAALSSDAIKLSAKQVAGLPLPAHSDSWDRGAELAQQATDAPDKDRRRTALTAMGAAMCDAYGVGREPVMAWWTDRFDAVMARRP